MSRVERALLRSALKRTLVPWLADQITAAEQRLAKTYAVPYSLAYEPSAWRDGRYPDQLAASLLANVSNTWTRFIVKITAPNAELFKSATVAVLASAPQSEAEFLGDLVVLTYSPDSKDQERARQRMLRSIQMNRPARSPVSHV